MTTLKQHSRMRGLFMIERQKHNPDGSPIPGTREVVAPWQDNLLLDSGLDNLAESWWMQRCSLGASSAPPDPTDTQLGSLLGSVNNSSSAASEGPSTSEYSSIVSSWVFPPGVATGIIAELGVGPTGGPLTTRSLVKDENSNPTTITKGPIDSLTVTYQIREYPDTGDSSYQITNPHTSQVYDVVSRAIGGMGARLRNWHQNGANWGGNEYSARYAALSSGLLPWDSTNFSGGAIASSSSRSAYVSGTYYRDLTCVWGENNGNVSGGIVSIRPTNPVSSSLLQASFDPPIDKDNTKTLSITLRKSWGRYEP